MADTGSIATMQKDGFDRLTVAMDALGNRHGIAPMVLMTHDSDPTYLQARRMQQMADYLEALVAAGHAPAKAAPVPSTKKA